MNLDRAEKLARDKMNEHNLGHWTFEFDDSVRRGGCCHTFEKRITLSKSLTEIRDEANVLNTILHEIAHALTPGCNHGKAWFNKAISIGCSGERCFTDATIQAPFKGTCKGCGRVIERHRRKKISCGKCSGGVFNKAYMFKWTRV